MRTLTQDKVILHLLDEIETYTGKISLSVMPEDHRALARCTIRYTPEDGWMLWHIPEVKTSNATLCHELAHLILLFEGWPAFIIDSDLPKSDYLIQTVSMLTNLVLHIEVWRVVKSLGFDEIPDYEPGLHQLIFAIKSGRLLSGAYTNEILPFRAAYIAGGLLCPAKLEIQKLLRDTASRTMPEALELADSIVRVFERLHPIDPKSSAEALSEICERLQIHRGILIASWPDIVDLHFRKRFQI